MHLCMLLQVIDLTTVSQELAYLASDADLVILEGMVRLLLSLLLQYNPFGNCLKKIIPLERPFHVSFFLVLYQCSSETAV